MGLGLVVRYQTTSNPAILGIGTTFPYDEFYGYEPVSISLGLGASVTTIHSKNVFAIAKQPCNMINHDDTFNFFWDRDWQKILIVGKIQFVNMRVVLGKPRAFCFFNGFEMVLTLIFSKTKIFWHKALS